MYCKSIVFQHFKRTFQIHKILFSPLSFKLARYICGMMYWDKNPINIITKRLGGLACMRNCPI